MPDDIDVPDWVSEVRASLRDRDDTARARRSDRRRRPDHPVGRERQRPGANTRPHRPTRTSSLPVEMVPPTGPAEFETRTGRRGSRGRSRPTSAVTFARRRAAAALVLTATLALLLWSFWPSQDSSSPARDTADLTAAAVRQRSDPTPAAEELASLTVGAPVRAGSAAVPRSGTGKVTPVSLPGIAPPTLNPSRTVSVGLEVEGGTGIDAQEAASIISATLGDRRGWQTRDKVRFRAASAADVESGDVDLTIVLASPDLTDELCAPLRTRGEVSCFNLRKVVLNVRRWTQGVSGYAGNLPAYREYMVNHEVGHGLYHGHVECPGKGKTAPVMLQQSKGLDGCAQNPWPTAG